MARGKFITFEGGEGCGKSTQVRRLKEALETDGIEVVLTRLGRSFTRQGVFKIVRTCADTARFGDIHRQYHPWA